MPTINLSSKVDREDLERQISLDIDNYCVSKFGNEHRNHLGASEMGKPCARTLYYKFHWVKKPDFDGRMLRLFNVGHQAEPRFIDYLRGIGFEVKPFAQELWYSSQLNDYLVMEWDADKSGGTGSYEPVIEPHHFVEAARRGLAIKQWRISGVMGHYGGSLDGMCKAPARYNLDSELVLLNEFKTNGTGAAYNKVAEVHLSKAKPEHFDQMCQYGFHYKLKYGLYLIENKNDSSLTIKIVELDWNRGAELQRRAEEIITAKEPPARISNNPAFQICSWCDFKGICHNGETPELNCRSCRNATAVDNANWHCSRHNATIPLDFIAKGCQDWNPL